MRIQAVESHVWWIALADEIRPREGVALQQMFNAVQSVFHFAEIPSKLPQPNRGYEFSEGHLNVQDGSPIAVTKLSVFNDGINIQVNTDTEKAERALQAALGLFGSLGLREPITPPLHYYLSNIVADFDRSLDSFVANPILKAVAAAVPADGSAHVYSLRINFDPSAMPGRLAPINPTNFLIERRIGVPYELNRYFSQANMSTESHLSLLEKIEKTL